MDLRPYQREAYQAVLKVVLCGKMGWDTEDVLAKLRSTLHITDDVHKELRAKVASDPEVQSLKGGMKGSAGMPHSGHRAMSPPLMGLKEGGLPGMGGPARRGGAAPGQLANRHSINRNYIAQSAQLMASTPAARGGMGAGGRGGMAMSLPDRAAAHMGMGSMGQPVGVATGAPATKPVNPRPVGSRVGPPMRDGSIDRGMGGMGLPPAAVTAPKSKSKTPGSMAQALAQALPEGLDLNTSNLQGLKCRTFLKAGPGYAGGWYDGIIAHVRDTSKGRACDIVYDLDKPNVSWTRDYIFRPSKAVKEWEIFDEREDRDWSYIYPPEEKKSGSGSAKRKRPSGGGALGGKTTPVAPTPTLTPWGSAALGSELGSVDVSRFDDLPIKTDLDAQAPFSDAYLRNALEAASTSGNEDNLQHMLVQVRKRRATVIDEVARLELQNRLDMEDVDRVTAKLTSELNQVRSRMTTIQAEMQACQ